MFFWTKVFVNSSSMLSEVVVTILCALFFNRYGQKHYCDISHQSVTMSRMKVVAMCKHCASI